MASIDETDEELMGSYVAGDVEAHRLLFDRLAPVLLHLARRQLRDQSDAEDVVQRSFLAIHRARHDFRDGARVRAWVFTIAMNLVRDAFRRRQRRRETPLDLDGRHDPAVWQNRLEQQEAARLVRRALGSLPPDQRRAIELHWLEERPFSEIAELVGATVSAVKVRAHRGYKGMRAFIETEHELGRTRD